MCFQRCSLQHQLLHPHFPKKGLLFWHALCTALVQCTVERHSVLQHSSPHAHTSLSDLNHNYKRYTQRQTAALYHHHTAWKQSRPIFSEQHCSRVKDVSHLVCHKLGSMGTQQCFLTCMTKSARGVFPFQQDGALNGSVGWKTQRAKVQQAMNDIWSLPLPNPCLYSADYDAEQRYFYQCGRAIGQVKNEKKGVYGPDESTLQKAFPQMSWGSSLQLSLSKTQTR